RIHDEIRDVRGSDREDVLDYFSSKTKRKYHGDLIPEGDLFEIDTEHHSEWNEGDDIRDHFTLVGVGERNQVEASRLKVADDRDQVVRKLEQHEPQEDEQVGGE